MSIPAFVNVRSGSAPEALRALRDAGSAFSVQALEPAGIARAVREALETGVGRIAVAGGDGTIATAASILARSPVELAVIPGGTLNHFARHLGIPRKESDAVGVAIEGTAMETDLGMVNGRGFINTSSVGAYVAYVQTREQFERHVGYRIASIFAAVRLLFHMPTLRVTLAIAGQEVVCNTPLVFVGVGERSLAPPEIGSRVPDGRRALHVMIVPEPRNARRWAHVYDRGIRDGAHETHGWSPSFVTDYLTDACRIELPRGGAKVATDGEVVAMGAPLIYELWRDAVRVVTARSQQH